MSKNLLYLFIISLVTGCIEVDMSVPSLPDISDYFGISDGLTQMTIAVNFFGFCISAALYGPLSENFGRRKMMIFGNGIMLIGAFGCMVAPNIETLLFARFIQGLGASASAVVVFVMIADLCSGKEAADIISRMNSTLSLTMAAAPIAGAFVNQSIGWRGNYGIVFLTSLIAWILLYFKLPETKKEFDPINLAKIAQDYRTLLTSKAFIIASLVPSLMFAGYMSFIACGSFLYMETYKLPIIEYSLYQGAVIASFSLTSQNYGKICEYLGERNSVIYGLYMLMIAGICLCAISILEIDSPILTTASMIVGVIGAAVSYPLVFAKSFEIFPKIKGSASSAIMSMRMLVTGATIALISLIYDGSLFRIAIIILIANSLGTVMTLYIIKILNFADND